MAIVAIMCNVYLSQYDAPLSHHYNTHSDTHHRQEWSNCKQGKCAIRQKNEFWNLCVTGILSLRNVNIV